MAEEYRRRKCSESATMRDMGTQPCQKGRGNSGLLRIHYYVRPEDASSIPDTVDGRIILTSEIQIKHSCRYRTLPTGKTSA